MRKIRSRSLSKRVKREEKNARNASRLITLSWRNEQENLIMYITIDINFEFISTCLELKIKKKKRCNLERDKYVGYFHA